MLSTKPRDGLAPPEDVVSGLDGAELCQLSFGGNLQFFMENAAPRIEDPYLEGMLRGAARAGTKTAFMTVGSPGDSIRRTFNGAERVPLLQEWRPAEPSHPECLQALEAVWKAWLGPPGRERRLPDYRGVKMHTLAATHIEELLPHLAVWMQDVGAVEKLADATSVKAVLFSNFASSHRHLILPLKKRGVKVIAPAIGIAIHSWLFYGAREPADDCPIADLYPVWGEFQASRLKEACPAIRVVAPGRARHDTFVERASRDPSPEWLTEIGLPASARKLIVFADVLRGTLKQNIIGPEDWLEVVKVLLRAVADRPDIHVVVKPWLGDSLNAVQELAASISDPKFHIFDPTSSPFHNAELLRHALTVVSSPTSLLAEFVSMGGTPVMLSLPTTRYYYGERLHDLYSRFCQRVDTMDALSAALGAILEKPNDDDGRRMREAAVTELFGPSDGHSADRFAEIMACEIG